MIMWSDVIDGYVEKDAKSNDRPAPARCMFYASALYGCLRQAVKYKAGMIRFPISARKSMLVGTILHRWINDIAISEGVDGVDFEKEVTLRLGDCIILGHVDAFDGEVVYDFKTTKNLDYVKRYGMHDGYRMQLSAYAHALGVDRARIVWIDKRDLRVDEYDVEPMYTKAELGEFCRSVVDGLDRFRSTGELPPFCDKDSCYGCRNERRRIS